jgi:hypothetical protein
MTKKNGFTGKVTGHSSGLYLRIPENTVQSMDLKDEDLLQLELRNMNGETLETSREVKESAGQCKVYLGKDTRKQLGLEHKDLVDVFLHKK